jgi:hypothetical protein
MYAFIKVNLLTQV